MIKKLLVVSLAALGIGLTGCLTDPEESSAPTISGPAKIDTLKINSPVLAVINIESNDSISNWTYKITNSSGTQIATITATPAIKENKPKSKKIEFTLVAGTGAVTATDSLVITATAGVTSTVSFPLFVIGSSIPNGTPDLTTKTVTLGAHDNATTGSSVDLDAGVVMFAKDAKAANSGVDIVYTFSEKLNKPVIMNPAYAKTSSGITAFEGWEGPNATQFHIVPNVDFESITTAAQIQALFNVSLVGNGRVEVAANDVLVVKTDKGAYVLVKMNTVSKDTKGTATIKYAK